MLLIFWEKNWVCSSVNVYYSSIKNSHPCLFSCGDVIWIQCIKDRLCVLIETIKSNVAPRKVFLFQMYFVTSALDQTIITVGDERVYKRWWCGGEVCFAHYSWYMLIFISEGPGHVVPLRRSVIMSMSSTKNKAGWKPAASRWTVCPIIFWSQTKCCVWTSIDRGYLRVLQLHFIVTDAMEGWTVYWL